MDRELPPETVADTENIDHAIFGNSDAPQDAPQIDSASVAQEQLITEQSPAFLGQNSDAIEPIEEDQVESNVSEMTNQFEAPQEAESVPADENVVQQETEPEVEEVEEAEPEVEQETEHEAEANSSVSNIHSTSMRSFATPSKLLPPLKDIEHITTPKSFGVAKDHTSSGGFKSSPVQIQNNIQLGNLAEVEEDAFDNSVNDTFANSAGPSQNIAQKDDAKSAELTSAAAFLDVHPQALLSGDSDLIKKLAQRAQGYSQLQSELSFFRLNQEQIKQVQSKKYEDLQRKLDALANANSNLQSQNEEASLELSKREDVIVGLRSESFALSEKVQQLEKSIQGSESGHKSTEHENALLGEEVSTLTRANAEQGQRISELTRDLNDSKNEAFASRLEMSKVANELSYMKKQKVWYETQLKAVQDKYTDLIKRHETDFLRDSNKIASLAAQTDSLTALKDSFQKQVTELSQNLDKVTTSRSDLELKLEVSHSRSTKELDLKSETIELLNIQLQERSDRIAQLETYTNDLKESTSSSVESLQYELTEKEDKIAQIEEKLRRAEEALDSELHKETQLPKLTPSAELILQESSSGISLSTLYTEFNHIKKELVLEKSQKEKLASQLQHFITELESKKPAIANYRNQISYYEKTLNEVLGKMESIRVEKTESEKECIRLRTRLASHENEILSIKQLSKDLGRQLCFYLIHSKIREGNEDPLTSHEKKVIDQILAKSGNKDVVEESDTDRLITERLIGFDSIIDLQKKNEELTTAIRSLGKQLEEKDSESNGFEAAAVEEAKEAILTLQSELDSITLKYDAVSKERDLIKSLNGASGSPDVTRSDLTYIRDANTDLRKKAQEAEASLRQMQTQSQAKLKELSESLNQSKSINEDLKMKATAARHSAELSESRLQNANKLLDNARKEIDHSHKEAVFWKGQSSKQEELLVRKSNELRDAERQLSAVEILQKVLQTEKEVWTGLQSSLTNEITSLKNDKSQLNSFVFNLQALLKERETSSTELSKKLSQSVENYQGLQAKINEKEERISILASQSDMALRAQNAKLEQVNELSQKLLEARSLVASQEAAIDQLKKDIARGSLQKPSTRTSSLPAHLAADNNTPVLASEYNDLKEALKLAEAQVVEFSNIAKSAEDALSKATESFDAFREQTSEKLRLLEDEKTNLLSEADSQTTHIEDLRGKLQQHLAESSSQIQDLQAKLQNTTSKAESYDLMKSDYEKRIASMVHDITNQASVSDEVQKRYEAKVSESESANKQLVDQNEKLSEQAAVITELTAKLESKETELQEKEERLNEAISGQDEELQRSQIKLKDLQYQYDLALTQLELQKPSEADDSESGENLRQVITYLRAEKEAADSKVTAASDEVSQLKIQLETISAELKASKSQISRLSSIKIELDDTNKDHARLLEQLEQLNILRESNSTLRNDNQSCRNEIKELQAKIESLASAPVNNDNGEQAEVQAQELRLLKEENVRLKKQSNNNEELEKLQQRFENVKTEYLKKLAERRNRNKELELQLQEIKSQLETTSKELNESKSSLNDGKSSLSAQLKQSEAERVASEKRFTDEITALKTDFEKQKNETTAAFQAKLAEAQTKASGSAGVSEAQIKAKLDAEWQQKLEKVVSDMRTKLEKELEKKVEQKVRERTAALKKEDPKQNLQQAQERIKKEYEAKIDALNQSFEKKLASEKASAEKAAGTKYEFKLKVLNRKLEKLQGKESTPSATTGIDNQNKPSPSPAKQPAVTQSKSDQNAQSAATDLANRLGNKAAPTTTGNSAPGNTAHETNQGSKRQLPQEGPPSINFKRSKD